MKNNNVGKKVFVIGITLSLFCYLSIAFINLTVDPRYWNQAERIALVGLVATYISFIPVLIQELR